VCLPNGNSTLGFLGLYDDDIAIATSLGFLRVDPLDLYYESVPVSSDDHVIAAGRAFCSYGLRALDGFPCTECRNTWVSTSDTTKVYAVHLFVFSHDGKLDTNNCVMMLVVRYHYSMLYAPRYSANFCYKPYHFSFVLGYTWRQWRT